METLLWKGGTWHDITALSTQNNPLAWLSGSPQKTHWYSNMFLDYIFAENNLELPNFRKFPHKLE